jgi:hypothetical protein
LLGVGGGRFVRAWGGGARPGLPGMHSLARRTSAVQALNQARGRSELERRSLSPSGVISPAQRAR